MKTHATKIIEDSRANLAALEKDIESSINRLTVESAALALLEESCDLNDTDALNRIGQKQILVALIPRRVAAKEGRLEPANAAVVGATNNFISSEFTPRLRDARNRAKSKIKAALAPHFNGDALDKAVQNSELVVKLEELDFYATLHQNPANGPVKFAEQTLAAWEKLNVLESKIS